MKRPNVITWAAIALAGAARLFAAGPQITGYQVDGNAITVAPVSVTSSDQGLQATVGWQGTAYPVPDLDATARGVTSLRVFITPNDGGFITFRYRFQSNGTMGYQGWTRYSDTGSNHFRAKVVYGFQDWGQTYSWDNASVREAFWRWQTAPWSEGGQLYDTHWMETSIYVHPGSGVELWLSVGSWGGYPAWVEIQELIALCTATSPIPSAEGEAAAPRFMVREPERELGRIPRSRRIRATSSRITATSVTPACKGCCVSALTPVDPADTDSITMEAGYAAWDWLARCTTEIQDATPCFRDKVIAAGGAFPLNNTLRTAWYQRHFREIWDKVQALNKDTSADCAAVKQQAKQEKAKHGLAFRPAGVNPRHVNGEAIDLGKHYGITEALLLDLAGQCNLYRRVPAHKVHYEYQQP